MDTVLARYPSATELLERLQSEESKLQTETIATEDVELLEDGRLQIGTVASPLADNARNDLARLARIPTAYFTEIDNSLRAVNFNRRLSTEVTDRRLAIISNDNGLVEAVRGGQLLSVPRSRIVQAVLDASPADTVSNSIVAVVYALNGHMDVSLVAPALQTQPRVNDIVLGGVHLGQEDEGAIQIGPATFRLICSNGAMARVCANGKHRIRRGSGPESGQTLLENVASFAQEAWSSWPALAEGIGRLASERLGNMQPIIQRLRDRPFFISAAAARRVQEALSREGEAGSLTLFDLHNAITAVGSHDDEVLPQYRYRLRLGAGVLARGRVGVCRQCGRMVLA
jgi:hypothetical protein